MKWKPVSVHVCAKRTVHDASSKLWQISLTLCRPAAEAGPSDGVGDADEATCDDGAASADEVPPPSKLPSKKARDSLELAESTVAGEWVSSRCSATLARPVRASEPTRGLGSAGGGGADGGSARSSAGSALSATFASTCWGGDGGGGGEWREGGDWRDWSCSLRRRLLCACALFVDARRPA